MSKNPEELEKLKNTIASYFPDANYDIIEKAFYFAKEAHKEQKRSSGDPYIIHPIAVAQTLAEMHLDTNSIITGLLHDTVEDTTVTLEEIEKEFGKESAELVDGVTKLSKMTFKTSEEKQAENFRKMIIAMAKDIRVILVKLADRLNNMQTLDHLPEFKQKEKAQETSEIYAPIANRLGISWLKIELEDLCLRYLHPDVYYKLAQKITKTKKERENHIEEVCNILSEKLKDYSISATISGRAKHFQSIFNKMERRKVDFNQIHDLIAFRITVDNITECYKALGVIHATYKPVPGRFKDYIAMPKANSYQSLHTTVIGPHGERVEMQIRTTEMHQTAEQGIAAHWKYKEGKFGTHSRENIEWVHRLLEWQKDLSDPAEFLETVKIDLFSEDVFVFTPAGEVRKLSFGATPLDFAFSIHTDVGSKCIGAKVNGKIVPLKHRLKSGDTIEVITSPTQTPTKDWLNIVKSSKAKAKIRAFIKKQERDRAKELGREILEKALRDFSLSINRLEKSDKMKKTAAEFNFKTLDELYVAVGYGRIFSNQVLEKIVSKEEYDQKFKVEEESIESVLEKTIRSSTSKAENRNAIIVSNLDDVLIRFGKCCAPLPGDGIIGFITRGRGVTIHTYNCTKALDNDPERRVDVRWNIKSKKGIKRNVKIRILCHDESGLLALMTQTITQSGINITSANIKTTKDKKAICFFDIEVTDIEQLQKVIGGLEAKQGVIAVERSRS